MHASITSYASFESHDCITSYASIESHDRITRIDRIACLDHIICTIATHACMHACIDRVTCIDHITWHRSHDMLDFVTVWPPSGDRKLTVLNRTPPCLTQEDTDVRACTTDANLIAPTSTDMLHIYEQQLLIRHSHYSIWKLCWFHFIHQSESSVLDRVEAWTAIITVRTQVMPTPCNTSRVTD